MPTTAVLVHDCGNPLAPTERFRVRMAQTLDDVIDCQRLRYLVFNCELGEGRIAPPEPDSTATALISSATI
jgi:hypothetical protein